MLKNIKSEFFIKIIFMHLNNYRLLKTIKYDKFLQNKLNIGLYNYKLFKGRFLRHFKKIPVEQLSIEGFHLLYTDVEKNDPVAQRALRTVNEYGLRFYGKQETPVFYFVREGK